MADVAKGTVAPAATSLAPTVRYASFTRRLVAAIIDSIIVSVISQLIMVPLGLIFGLSSPFTMNSNFGNDEAQAMAFIAGFMGMFTLVIIVSIILHALYFGGLLVYKQGQTLGKMAMGIRVVTVDGKPITWGKALLREVIGKWISSLVLLLGYFWAIWDAKKQAWHDKIAGTYVVYAK